MPVVALLTDFGLSDPYVGQLKGVLLTGAPDALIIDLSHDIRPFDILQAAFYLSASAPHFPDNALFLSVVDPGVGTSRRLILVRKKNQMFLAPDNGILGLVTRQSGPTEVWELPLPVSDSVSRTFHGRDILAPAAARLCQGIRPGALGRSIPLESLVCHARAVPELNGQALAAHVLHQDRFGNLVTNLAIDPWLDRVQKSHAPLSLTVHEKHYPITLTTTYADIPAQRLGLIPGSQGFLELAVNQGNAATILERGPGDRIVFNLS